MGGIARWLWLPALVSAACAGVVYRLAFASELGSRAGAEPRTAGLVVAFPFIALALLQSLFALYAGLAPPVRGLVAIRWCSSLAAVVVVTLVVAWSASTTMEGYGSPGRLGATLLIVAALVLPLVPAWTWGRRQRGPRPTSSM